MYDELLEDRTVNIILLAKRFGVPENVKRAIAKYMSEECWCPVERYTDEVLYSIVKNAAFDFLHHASRRSDAVAFFRQYLDALYEKSVDRMIIALSMIQVCEKDGWEYKTINGWHETEFTKKLDAEEWKLDG